VVAQQSLLRRTCTPRTWPCRTMLRCPPDGAAAWRNESLASTENVRNADARGKLRSVRGWKYALYVANRRGIEATNRDTHSGRGIETPIVQRGAGAMRRRLALRDITSITVASLQHARLRKLACARSVDVSDPIFPDPISLLIEWVRADQTHCAQCRLVALATNGDDCGGWGIGKAQRLQRMPSPRGKRHR